MEKEETTSVANVQNYVKLHKLLNGVALPLIRIKFMDNWNSKFQRGWETSPRQGEEFLGLTAFGGANTIQQKMYKSGDIQKWNIPMTVDALKFFLTDEESSQKQQSYFDKLNEVRDQICLHGGLNIDDKLFEQMWTTLSDALLNLGATGEELEEAKKDSSGSNQTKMDEALSYLNRSVASSARKNYYAAKDDAICVTILAPSWAKGYGRLGHVYLSEGKYEQALSNFNKAIELDPKCALQNDRDHCRYMYEKIQRAEHLDPTYRPGSLQDVAEKVKGKDGSTLFTPEMIAELSQAQTLKHLPTGMVAEGHKYLYGHGYEQSYEMAVKWFSKAALLGSAEGLYNLGILTKQGKGIAPDIAGGIRLIRLAASQNIAIDLLGTKIPNVGVVDAEHSLALSYMEGIGVPQDYKKAIQWYTRAIKHGSGVSANNVGKLYYDGSGVKQDKIMALNFYKLGAHLKTVRAMENLVDVYLREFDLVNAVKWYKYAILKGSEYLDEKKESMSHLLGVKMDTPIDAEMFEKELLEELSDGPIAHLIPVDLPPSPEELLQKLALQDPDVIIPSATKRSELGLTDPYRIAIITSHRKALRERKSEKLPYGENIPKPMPKPNIDLFSLKQIFFADMGAKRDEVFEGYALKLTFIEDCITGRPSIEQIAEDEKGDAQRIVIHNFPQNSLTQQKIGFGCKITLLNPHYRMANDRKPKIHVDDIKLMVLHSTEASRKHCRFCINEFDTAIPCRHCKRTFYCSKACMKKDSMDLNHKEICFKRL